jgi:DNA-binding CsgD family transcriptional regulator
MPGDFLASLFYMVLGALALFALQQLARFVRRRMPGSPDPESPFERRLDFSAGVIDTSRQDPIPERYWLWDNLTAREMEIARLVAQGKHNAEIARELQISSYTVETHLKHTYAKLGVGSRTELAHVVRELAD